MCYEEQLSILEQQEQRLRFPHFTADDALQLGLCLIDEARERGVCPAFSIRLSNGFTVFQYGFQGTGLDHQNWMRRKERTVAVKMMSTLRCACLLASTGADL